jgi:dTDP-glucose 4,6-dehydratase
MDKILVTGGAGFIGSNFVRLALRERPQWHVVVIDKLTYAGRLENLQDVRNNSRFSFVHGDICNPQAVAEAMQGCDMVFNFAAESHVDRSLMGDPEHAGAFVQTDVYGVYVLLEEAKRQNVSCFLQVSTDEVYGHVPEGYSHESDPLEPRSPYSASKAGGELIARSYFVSHDMPIITTRGSNTFGPYQYPEKLLSLFITNAIDDLPLPMYGDGLQRRDWLFVEDHCRGVLLAAENGKPGEVYNVGGGNERTNREITESILRLLDKSHSLVQHVVDRPGHDRRYALNCDKIKTLGWQTQQPFEDALELTVEWYRENESWWRPLKTDADYQEYYKRNYQQRSV